MTHDIVARMFLTIGKVVLLGLSWIFAPFQAGECLIKLFNVSFCALQLACTAVLLSAVLGMPLPIKATVSKRAHFNVKHLMVFQANLIAKH